MNSTTSSIVVWNPSDLVVIPNSAESPEEIVKYGSATLSKRDINSIVSGFKAEGYEMVSTFVWSKASAAMKKQLATLGMEFVGEMLGRPDLNDDADPTTAIADHEVITLAEDLGMITATQSLRLKHSLQIVTHFASLVDTEDPTESMQKEEAVSLLRTCVTSILGKPRFEAAMQFAEFRTRLRVSTLQTDDASITSITNSPYFFVRTTLSVLLSMIKSEKGAFLEHAVGNTMLLIPKLWQRLRASEKWQIGQAYAEVSAAGNKLSSDGMRKTLTSVKGFDYVPESLRSSTFTEAAAKVLSAHFAMRNFYNEREPMSALSSLGTTIPKPAFAKCMEATLAVYLGNSWGYTLNAEKPATDLLDTLRPSQWEYYFNECLPSDRTVLDKLQSDGKPVARWQTLVQKYMHTDFIPSDNLVQKLLDSSRAQGSSMNVVNYAKRIRLRVGT
jgi:hypothetical protein